MEGNERVRVLKSRRTKFTAILLLTRIRTKMLIMMKWICIAGTQTKKNPWDQTSLSEGALELLEKSTQLLRLVNTHPDDYMGHDIDTRTKQRPSRNDIDNINRAVTQLMSQNSISPIDNPFSYLWLANCVLYSTVEVARQ